jgi:hypothetical protein
MFRGSVGIVRVWVCDVCIVRLSEKLHRIRQAEPT